MEDQSLIQQNEDALSGAGPAGGLGDRSGTGSNTPGRSGAGGGFRADDLSAPASGATDPSLDENEASYGNPKDVESR